MWVAIQSELDKHEGIRINVQQDQQQPQLADRLSIQLPAEESKKSQQITINVSAPQDGSPNRKPKPSQELEIETNNLNGLEETKQPHKNLETPKRPNDIHNETYYTEANSGVKRFMKMNSRIEGSRMLGVPTENEKTFIQDQTCFQSFVGEEEEKREMEANLQEVLKELYGGKNAGQRKDVFDTVHPRIKVIHWLLVSVLIEE